MPASGEQMVVYDFIYTNTTKIHSFYAQIFHGLLTSSSKTVKTSTGDEKAKGVGYSKTHASSKSSSVESEQLTMTVDPNEIITIDTLSTLAENAKDIHTASNGDIVKIKADMFLMDKPIFDLMMPNIAHFMMLNAPKSEHKEIKKIATLLKKMFESIRFDPIVFASMEESVAVGNIKEEYLSESITSFHLKHGKSGLSEVYMIGIKEEGAVSINHSDEGLINGAMEFSDIVKNMIIPDGAYTFTPLAIYREITLDNE